MWKHQVKVFFAVPNLKENLIAYKGFAVTMLPPAATNVLANGDEQKKWEAPVSTKAGNSPFHSSPVKFNLANIAVGFNLAG